MEQKDNSGALFRYTGKKDGKMSSPDYRGTALIAGKKYQLAGWINKSKAGQSYLRVLFFDLPEKDLNATGGQATMPLQPKSSQDNTAAVTDDDLPF